jgi:two-component system, OmpR family, response regulator CpxR
MERILIIDDDTELTELVGEYLKAEGFEIETVHEGTSGLARAMSGEHTLAIVDVMLPGMNGLDIVRELRKHSRMPVLILTARGEDVDRIVGLEIGADDYLPKPFNPRELAARIRAILRRAVPSQDSAKGPEKIVVGEVQLDPAARTVLADGEPVELTSVEFDVLEALMRAAGQVVTREQIAQDVLGRKFMPYDRSIDMHVSKLRRKVGEEHIKTIRGVGYIYAKPTE